ncbi:ribose-phosphate pyrophosphokinase [Noviherbaspirillum autotrophicum]|uniref:Phosphoribosylpyrophosphate synthetase n=1 Tax=Noviherbaspirillum autotrophicum TaxID=709839 RepID=A0A0C1XYS4_9BURK|nr:ribose-phosphate pyrophosphokinase [Noviherbaspirillum autotrophicum]KIF79898.1 phosphoribosylpyrophosphate synthetase [Noviherbaspirillum autotrophicum]
MIPILFAMPGNEAFVLHLDRAMSCEVGQMEMRRFPDGETYVRLLSQVRERDVIFVCTLDHPDEKMMSLYLAARTARELGARRVGLVAPYLAYMRQDARFLEGEGITSVHFASFVSDFCDWLVTVDPHLHRHHRLNEIYSIPTKAVRAAPHIGEWIAANIEQPVIVGPDAESEQWAAKVAKSVGCPYTVLNKIRKGDRDVEVLAPGKGDWQGGTPVLVDDIASTANTMIAAAEKLKAAGLPPPVCIAVHPIFAGNAYAELQAAGVARIVSCNTIAHPSNGIDISDDVAVAAVELMAILPIDR